MLRGHLDLVTRHGITGWAYDTEDPSRPVSLVITCNGAFSGRLLANRYRGDLERGGIGDGRYSFEFNFPLELGPFEAHEICVVRESGGVHLPRSPFTLPALQDFGPSEREALERYLGRDSSDEIITAKIDFLAEQLDRLLQRQADHAGESRKRAQQQQLRLRWGRTATFPEPTQVKARPHALVIDDRLPQLDRDAGSHAIVSHMRSLQRLGFDVCFVAAREFRAVAESANPLEPFGIEVLAPPYCASVEEALRRRINQFDLIYLHRVHNAAKYGAIARECDPRAVILYSVADLHHLRVNRQASVEQRPELEPLARRLRLAEMTATATSDVVITHSDVETHLLRKAVPHAHVVTVPWSVTPRPVQVPFAERKGIAFIGGFGHDPNRDAARWLVSEILPLIRQRTDIPFLLVGSDLPDDIRRLCGDHVTAVGQVADLQEIFGRVRATIAPLAYGAGIKGKVLESLAAGIPCACTPIAAEGIPLPPELRNYIADDATSLADVALRLHEDAAANAAAAASGLAMIAGAFSDACVDAALRDALGKRIPGLGAPHSAGFGPDLPKVATV